MQEQMSGAAVAMPPDPNKAFKVSPRPFQALRKAPALTHSCLCVPERVGGAGDRGAQVGAGERGGGAHGPRPEPRRLLQPGGQGGHGLAGLGTRGNRLTNTEFFFVEYLHLTM